LKTVLYILQKEFIQVFRDKALLPMILIVPVMQLLVLSYAATFEIKMVRLVAVDFDKSGVSHRIIDRFNGSPFYKLAAQTANYAEAEDLLKKDKADQIIVIPEYFSKSLTNEKRAEIQLVTNAINGSAASLMNSYALNIIMTFNKDIIVKTNPLKGRGLPVEVRPRFRYNPELDYKTYMVPGILVLLVTIIGMILTSMNIVKEKEVGTIEQLNVAPINRFHFIAGKLIPFWIIAMFDLLLGLAVARFAFSISIEGSVFLLLGVASVYLVVVLSFGLFVSTFTETMQQAMFVSYFFLVIFILLSGLFTPIESMPRWAQYLDYLNPLAYFIKINRMIMLKGSSFSDFQEQFYSLAVYAAVMLSFATFRHRKTV